MSVPSLTRFKRCTKCGITYPAIAACFNYARTGLYGRRSYCKACARAYNKRYQATVAVTEKPVVLTKCCSECGETKSASHFCKNRGSRDGLSYRCKACDKRWREANKDMLRASNKRWREANKDYVNALSREWYDANKDYVREYRKHYRAANLEAVRARERAYNETHRQQRNEAAAVYREANRERINDVIREYCRKNREQKLEYNRQWREKNPEKLARQRQQRRSRKFKAEGSHTPEEVQQMLEDQGGVCCYCEKPLPGLFHIEHLIPISRGGSNDWSNIAVSCASCNTSKRDKTAAEFMNRRLFGVNVTM